MMEIGNIIQNYRLVKFIGDGGMGQVWLGEHTLLGRKVAIKGLHPQFARNAGIRARFKQEAATLAHLQHPNIVALHDYIEEGDAAYLVMEYVDGLPLDDYISKKTGPIPTPQLKQLFGQILDGFVYAHGKKIVHRDIKPSNFLVTADGVVKILDFGIAKILTEGNQKLTKTGTNLGTVLYMSPEQVRGEAVDVRSDIYSLGVTLFQMATGQCPYDSETAEYVVYDKIVNQPLPKAVGIYPGVTPDIEALIAKATAKAAAQRYQDCGEFKRAMITAAVTPVADPLAIDLRNPSMDAPDSKAPQTTPMQPAISPQSQAAAPAARIKGLSKTIVFGVMIVVLLVAAVLVIWKPWVQKSSPEEERERLIALKDSLYSDSVNHADDSDHPSQKPRDDRHADSDFDGRVPAGEEEMSEPEKIVRGFYAELDQEDYYSAWLFTDGKVWGDYEAFKRKNAFGCTTGAEVYSTEMEYYGYTDAEVDVRVKLVDFCKEKDQIMVRNLRLYVEEDGSRGWRIVKMDVLE